MGRGTIAFALIFAAATSLRGQGKSPRVHIALPERVVAGTGVASTSITGILTEGHRLDLLHNGWPTAIHGKLELWRQGRFGPYNLESDYQWDVIVEYSPASKLYHLRRIVENVVTDLGEVSSIQAAEQLLRQPFSPPLSPERSGGRYFYLFNAEVSTLSLTDIKAWQDWLRGEAAPAVKGKRSPVSAFKKGLGTALSRMLGGDTQTYETRSPFIAG
jgi:hypothetical protein